MKLWLLFKPSVLSGFLWHCCGRGRDCTNCYQMELEVQVPLKPLLTPEWGDSFLLLGRGGSFGLLCHLYWDHSRGGLDIVKLLTFYQAPSDVTAVERRRGASLLLGGGGIPSTQWSSSTLQEKLFPGQRRWKSQLTTWYCLTPPRQRCWGTSLQPPEGRNLGSTLGFCWCGCRCGYGWGHNFFCGICLQWSSYYLKAFCLFRLHLPLSFG